MPAIRFTRTRLDTWAWSRDGEVVGGTAHTNPKQAMEEGLDLLEEELAEGSVGPDEAREALEEARDRVLEGEPGEAHRSAAEVAGRFLRGLERSPDLDRGGED